MSAPHCLLALAACVAAFAALGLAMDRPYADAYGRGCEPSPGQRRSLRLAGAGGLLLSLWACLAGAGTAHGWVLWFGVMTLSAQAVTLLLSYAPRRARHALQGLGLLALASAAWATWAAWA